MNDMSQVIIPKSDQINAETLLAGPMTVTIKDVHIRGGQEQPVSIELEETPLFFRPCKSMSRVLVACWGPDAKNYVGRSLTLYRDPSVKWAGMEVGGIRISHMSHIDSKMTMALTATKGSRKPFVVEPLVAEVKPINSKGKQTAEQWAASHREAIDAAKTPDELALIETKGAPAMTKLAKEHAELHAELVHAYSVRRSALAVEGKPDEDTGEGFGDDDLPADF